MAASFLFAATVIVRLLAFKAIISLGMEIICYNARNPVIIVNFRLVFLNIQFYLEYIKKHDYKTILIGKLPTKIF